MRLSDVVRCDSELRGERKGMERLCAPIGGAPRPCYPDHHPGQHIVLIDRACSHLNHMLIVNVHAKSSSCVNLFVNSSKANV